MAMIYRLKLNLMATVIAYNYNGKEKARCHPYVVYLDAN